MTEHTKLPWRSVRNTGVRNDGGYVVFSKAKPSHYPGQDERYEKEIAEWHGNLEYIALACNSHEDLLTLLKVAKCPNCDGSGGIPHQVGEQEWEQEQCQWCYEREEAIKKAKP